MNAILKTQLLLILACTTLVLSPVEFSQAAKGGGGKISVEAAEPNNAVQGDTLDVFISGSGLENASEIEYLVNGTNDNSQIEVLEIEFDQAKGKLRSRIKVNGNATIIDYDIKVRTTSGRKGKGTSLFKVQESDTPPNPALAVSGFISNGSHIYVVDADGGNLTKVVNRASGFRMSSMPTVWSADGSKIIWTDNSRQSLRVVDADGSNEIELLKSTDSIGVTIGGQRNLAVASSDCDGNEANLLYFLGSILDEGWVHEEFFVMDLDAVSPIPFRLTYNQFERHFTLAVSPDGLKVATWTNEEPLDSPSSPTSRLEIRDLCSPDMPVQEFWTSSELGLEVGVYLVALSWSVNDLLAAVVRKAGQEQRIGLIDLAPIDGNVTATIIIGDGTGFGEGARNHRLAWSPEGSILAFVSDSNVYTLEIGTGEILFVVNAVQDRDLDWRPTWELQK